MIKKINKFLSEKYKALFEKKTVNKRKQRNQKFAFLRYNINQRKRVESNNDFTIYYYLIWFFLITSSIYTLFFSPYFIIKNIDVIKNDTYSNINIAYKSINNLYYRNIFSINKDKIEKDIKELQNNIEYIKINKLFPDALQIDIKSFKWIFNTNINNKDYTLLENWSLIPSTNNEELEKIIINTINSNSNIVYKNIISESDMGKILYSINFIKNNIYIEKLKEINFFPNENELHINIIDKDKIILLLDNTIKNQLNKFILLKNKELIKLEDIIYIDLRVEDKSFICRKEFEVECNNNLKNIYNYKKTL